MRVIGVLLLMLLPVQAMALSCIRPTVERSFAEASASKENYVIVEGRITLPKGKKLPNFRATGKPPPEKTLLVGTVSGRSLTRSGFNVPFEKKVTFEVLCFGPWCGNVQNGEEVLAFLRKKAGGYALEVSPCGGRMFGSPKPAMLKKAQQCLRRGC